MYVIVEIMEIQSLGCKTNLMFVRFSGSVTDKGHYTVIQTPSNPGYHWGNYLVFDRPPRRNDLKEWTALFDKEFSYYQEPHHYVFSWDGDNSGDCQEFLAANFELDSSTALTASQIHPPPHLNENVEVKKIMSDAQWTDAIENQNRCGDPKYFNDYYADFKRRQMMQYRKMSEAGHGNWFGAYLDGKLVGDLGLFFDGDVGRYQSIGTHPEYRRQGICGTLVYKTGLLAMKEWGVRHLVMEADPDYHAARIYESVGFRKTEISYALSWWRGK